MKIICTRKQKNRLQEEFNRMADIPKVWGHCPLGFIYCQDIPLGDIETEKCRKCVQENIEWEVTVEDSNGHKRD
jgi:hypothetical protein